LILLPLSNRLDQKFHVKVHLEDLNLEGKMKLGKGEVTGELITSHKDPKGE
jgi:hypothetical protein